jgi:hypothetical protein
MNLARSVQELHWQAQVELGGGLYRGVQPGDASLKLSPLVLFDDPSQPKEKRSTMCLKPADLSADAVRSAIRKQQETYAAFEKFADKAVTRVFRQFGQPPLRITLAAKQAA